ncbi:MAG: preprotein translocase subunit YajC [Acidimicrobiia bacterium]
MNSLVLAQDATGSGTSSLIFLALMIGVFYFLIIRPQRRRSKAQQQLASSLKAGDEVRTIGGIHGTIISLDEESVVLRVEEGKIRVARRAVGGRVDGQTGGLA